uniref:Uncharacterized protein n=1 Tax=Trichogramma kaykai TaxID=54128 RepID=A0ABD2X517_9HYME
MGYFKCIVPLVVLVLVSSASARPATKTSSISGKKLTLLVLDSQAYSAKVAALEPYWTLWVCSITPAVARAPAPTPAARPPRCRVASIWARSASPAPSTAPAPMPTPTPAPTAVVCSAVPVVRPAKPFGNGGGLSPYGGNSGANAQASALANSQAGGYPGFYGGGNSAANAEASAQANSQGNNNYGGFGPGGYGGYNQGLGPYGGSPYGGSPYGQYGGSPGGGYYGRPGGYGGEYYDY